MFFRGLLVFSLSLGVVEVLLGDKVSEQAIEVEVEGFIKGYEGRRYPGSVIGGTKLSQDLENKLQSNPDLKRVIFEVSDTSINDARVEGFRKHWDELSPLEKEKGIAFYNMNEDLKKAQLSQTKAFQELSNYQSLKEKEDKKVFKGADYSYPLSLATKKHKNAQEAVRKAILDLQAFEFENAEPMRALREKVENAKKSEAAAKELKKTNKEAIKRLMSEEDTKGAEIEKEEEVARKGLMDLFKSGSKEIAKKDKINRSVDALEFDIRTLQGAVDRAKNKITQLEAKKKQVRETMGSVLKPAHDLEEKYPQLKEEYAKYRMEEKVYKKNGLKDKQDIAKSNRKNVERELDLINKKKDKFYIVKRAYEDDKSRLKKAIKDERFKVDVLSDDIAEKQKKLDALREKQKLASEAQNIVITDKSRSEPVPTEIKRPTADLLGPRSTVSSSLSDADLKRSKTEGRAKGQVVADRVRRAIASNPKR